MQPDSKKRHKKDEPLALLYARVPEGRIAMLRFVIEGCDNLATVSACGGKRDVCLLTYHPARREELIQVLETVVPGSGK